MKPINLLKTRPETLWVLLSMMFLLMPATASFAQEKTETEEAGGFRDWDADQDQQLNRDEFDNYTRESNFYESWDSNYDGHYDETETSTGLFNSQDSDKDGYLSPDEFVVGHPSSEPSEEDLFPDWDSNEDELLDAEEYKGGLQEQGFFREWQADETGRYSGKELNERLFDRWDLNNDGYISEKEYRNFGYQTGLDDDL